VVFWSDKQNKRDRERETLTTFCQSSNQSSKRLIQEEECANGAQTIEDSHAHDHVGLF
jgi:hypothetical protein